MTNPECRIEYGMDSFRSSCKFMIAVTSYLFVFNSYHPSKIPTARARSPLSQWSLLDVLPCCDPRYVAWWFFRVTNPWPGDVAAVPTRGGF